jgi:hypothetical protein
MQTPSTGMAILNPDPRQGTGFLEESPGNSSAMRLMCMMSLVTAITLSVFIIATTPSYKSVDEKGKTTLVYPPRDPQAIYLIYGFLMAAFAPKAIQKFAEQKLPVYSSTIPLGQPTTVVLPQTVPQSVAPQPSAMAPQPIEMGWTPIQNGQGQMPRPQPNGSAVGAQPEVNGSSLSANQTNSRIQLLQNRGGL